MHNERRKTSRSRELYARPDPPLQSPAWRGVRGTIRRGVSARRAPEPKGRQPGELRGFLQINLAGDQGVRYVGGELKQR